MKRQNAYSHETKRNVIMLIRLNINEMTQCLFAYVLTKLHNAYSHKY